MFVIFATLFMLLTSYFVGLCKSIDVSELSNALLKQHVVIYDCNDNLIAKYGDLQDYVPYDDIPRDAINALIATEDANFWSHRGIKVFSMLFAILENLVRHKIVRGGSTITQQLAKTVLLSHDPSLSRRKTERKIKEIIVALKLEQVLSKEQIMELYLNRVYFGRGAYGIGAASQVYLGKELDKLSLIECAFLVGLVQAPSRYSREYDKSIKRTAHVLRRMVKVGFIDQAQPEALIKIEQVPYQPKFKSGSFLDWVILQIPDWIRQSRKPISVRTTLDSGLQSKLMSSINKIKERSKFNFSELAFIACERDGAIKVALGGLKDVCHGFNRVTQAFRQAGSIFKIYTYLTAFMQGMKLDSTVEDTPPTIGDWTPSNYYHNEVGFVTLEQAFAESINGATVRVAMQCGLSNIINLARLLGLTGSIPNDCSLILGSPCITLYQLAQTILTIAGDGYQILPYGIVEIKDYDTGEILWKFDEEQNSTRLIDDDDALDQMLRAMKAVVDSPKGTGKMARSHYPVAGKTGTSQDYRDVWFGCVTPFMVACAWCGHDDNSPMERSDDPKRINPSVALCKVVLDMASTNYDEDNESQEL